MNSLPLSWFPFLNLLCILLLFQSSNGISYADEFYKACQNSFSCGSAIGIGYPFRGPKEPTYCGYPGFVLSCEEDNYGNVTTIDIMNVKYRVLDINQSLQTMRIAREDVMGGTCPEEMFNSTLDFSVFNYTSTYPNITFLYNCPDSPPGALPITCGKNGYGDQTAYVVNGTRGPGRCDSSITVPVPYTGNIGSGKSFRQTELNEVLQQGLEIKWKVSSQPCNDCSQSRGRCGYDPVKNQTTCFCPNAPYVNNTCSMASGASPEEAPTLTPG